MYTPTMYTDHRTYRHPPTPTMMLLLFALPLAVLLAVVFPTAAAGMVVGAVTSTALQR